MSAQFHSLANLIRETRPLFQVGSCLLIFGFLFSFIPRFYELFTLTGAQLVRFEVSRLITHCVVEKNLLLLVFAVYCLYRATFFETVWGTQELIKFICISQILSSFLVGVLSLIIYAVLRDDFFFFDVKINGAAALSVAVLVAVKQYLPDSILLTTPICRFKNTHLPAIAIFFACVFAAFGVLRWVIILQMVLGVQIAWMYLRFYQYHEDGEPKGDSSEHFAWATLFPSKLQPFMNWIGTALYVLSIKIRLCKPIVRRIDISHLESISILPTSQSKEAERKRQKAIRDLTERLSRSRRDDTGNWPEMDIADDEAELKQEAPSGQEAVPELKVVKDNVAQSDGDSGEKGPEVEK